MIALLALRAVAAVAAVVQVLCHLSDPRIAEASGIALSKRDSGVAFVQNDSGDRNRFFAVALRTGRTLATIRVLGARNIDWEDIASGPDSAGAPSVWLADIGDNNARRPQVQIYRVPEPRLDPAAPDAVLRTARPAIWRLRYPGGPRDAESFAVGPDGRGYIVTKSLLGSSDVYRLPLRPDPDRVQTLHRIGVIQLSAHGVGNPFGFVGELTATGAALSRNGAVFAVRTYASAYLWRVGVGGLAAALHRAPTRVDLPRQPQGEGITFAGRKLLVDSEGRHSAVLAVALPPRFAHAAGASRRHPLSKVVHASQRPSAGKRGQLGEGRHSAPPHRSAGGIAVGVIVLLIVIGTAVLLQRRRRRRRFRDDEPDEPDEPR